MDDLDDLVLNPSLRINADWQVRRKDQPIGQFRLVSPLQVPLLRVVLQVLEGNDLGSLLAVGVPRSLIDTIIEQGILVRKDQLPAAAEAFQCVPDPALVEMVPAEQLARYRQLAEDELELNPRRFVQTDGRVPEPMRGQLILGAELWQHLGRAEAWLGSFAADLPVLWTEHPA
jgi:hypothetical protein